MVVEDIQAQTVVLQDERILAYTEHGDLAGKPIIFFHGNPGSRLMRHPDESIVENLGARIITPDRPGYGYSSHQPKRTLVDMADDIEQLADALELDTFAVFGVSAGGPYVAATTFGLSDRVTAAAIVSGAAPFNRPNPYEGVNQSYAAAYRMAKLPYWILKPMFSRQSKASLKYPERALKRSFGYLSKSDIELLSQPVYAEQVHQYRVEAYRQGIEGALTESQILVDDWGIPLEQIRIPIHLWYWEKDTLVPPQMGRYLEMQLPNTIPHFLPNGGHFSIFTHWQAILEPLVDA